MVFKGDTTHPLRQGADSFFSFQTGSDDFMGEVYIKLTEERTSGAVERPWVLNLPLEPRKGHKDKVKGAIKVTLKFIPEGTVQPQ
jgi:hypothetical protein